MQAWQDDCRRSSGQAHRGAHSAQNLQNTLGMGMGMGMGVPIGHVCARACVGVQACTLGAHRRAASLPAHP